MPVFEYRGQTRDGRSVKGNVDAENVKNARLKLKKDGIFITDLRNRQSSVAKGKTNKRGTNKSVGVEDLSVMTRQLATLIKSNIPLVEALNAVSEQVENPTLKQTMSEIRDMVNEGSTLHKSLEKYPRIFDNIFVSMVEAGETSGTLDVILLRLAEFTESQNELASKVKSAMIYPVLMFVFTLGVLMTLFVYVIPQITEIFEQAELKLPWYSQVVIDFSGFLVNYWLIIMGFIALSIFLFFNWKRTPGGSAQWDAILLKLPVAGKFSRMIAVSRFTRTLSTLLAGGVPMLSAMDIVRNVVNNAVLAKAITEARDNISEGESIAGPLKRSEQFPPLVIHMIAIGEKTGDLEKMLSQVSDSYDFQVRTGVQGITALLEPVMIIMMGTVIGAIVFSIIVPMIEMTNISG
jgi:general secretion pathway protein F